MTSSLKEVQNLLKIKTVYLRSSFVKLSDEVDSDEVINSDTVVQSFRGVPKVKEASFKDEERSWWEYSFYYSVGIRLIEEESESDNIEETSPSVEIKATFCATYESPERLDKKHVDVFSENNVGYHVWPYWREFVQSSCMRMNIDSIDVPLYFCRSA